MGYLQYEANFHVLVFEPGLRPHEVHVPRYHVNVVTLLKYTIIIKIYNQHFIDDLNSRFKACLRIAGKHHRQQHIYRFELEMATMTRLRNNNNSGASIRL